MNIKTVGLSGEGSGAKVFFFHGNDQANSVLPITRIKLSKGDIACQTNALYISII